MRISIDSPSFRVLTILVHRSDVDGLPLFQALLRCGVNVARKLTSSLPRCFRWMAQTLLLFMWGATVLLSPSASPDLDCEFRVLRVQLRTSRRTYPTYFYIQASSAACTEFILWRSLADASDISIVVFSDQLRSAVRTAETPPRYYGPPFTVVISEMWCTR